MRKSVQFGMATGIGATGMRCGRLLPDGMNGKMKTA